MRVSLGVQHIFPWVTVQWLLQPLLIKGVSNQTDGASKNKETVEVTDLNNLIDLLLSKHPTSS